MSAATMDKMLDEGCPKCGSDDVREGECSVDGEDGIPCVTCDRCGHTEHENPAK